MHTTEEMNARDAMALAHSYFCAAKYDQAARLYQAVATAENGNFDAVHGVGVCHSQMQQYPEALVWLDRAGALAIDEMMSVTVNRAKVLGELGRTHEALATIDGLLRARPDHALALFNRGVLRMQIEQWEAAIEDFERALMLDPSMSYGNAKYGRGFANLVLGNYRDGFRDFEERDKSDIPIRPEWGPEWTGAPLSSGNTVLVLGEMGLGDMIQFGRYLPMLVARGAWVNVVVHAGVRPLLEGMPGITLFGETDRLPPSDYWTRFMSLAACFGTTLDTVPPPLELTYSAPLLTKWRERIPSDKLNIGLCWSGNPKSKYDQHRSIPLHLLEPLVNLSKSKDVRFYSFQQYVRSSDRDALFNLDMVRYLGPHLTDFRQTAHAMKCLDLMITCDTSVAHMAGTVGVPTWVMLTKFRTYWLWMKGRTDNPWYPSLRCIKQKVDGDWPEVIERAIDDLTRLI